MSNVILIGNGPSVKKHEFGDLIDSYETVVRFNWYHIDGYEKYVGTKTDVWFTSVFDPIRAKGDHDIFEHSWCWSPREDKTLKQFKDAGYKCWKTFQKLIFDIRKYMRMKQGVIQTAQPPGKEYEVWSTGALAAWWFLHEKRFNYAAQAGYHPAPSCDKIHMFGFDWWDMASDDFHHYGDSQTVGQNHKPQMELELFQYLHEDGKIYDLNPDSEFHKFYE